VEIKKVIAVVTGANRGIGRELVRALLDAGVKKVYATARDVNSLTATQALDPRRVHALQVDVTDRQRVMALPEAAGDVNTLLLDKTGTITLGNRQAVEFLPLGGVRVEDLAERAQLASLPDETPEGRSIVVLAKERFGLRARAATEEGHAPMTFVPFSAATRMSGINAAGPEPGVWAALLDLFVPLWPALAVLFISHGVSFFTNYLGRREYLGMDLKAQMSEPYKRIIVMHVTLIIGGFLTMLLRSPEAVLLLLIALKTAADLRAHRKEHAR